MTIQREHNYKVLKPFFAMAFRALLVLCIFVAGLLVGYVKFTPQPSEPQPVLIDIPMAEPGESASFAANDDIGDFILHHEYFAADTEALEEEPEAQEAVPEVAAGGENMAAEQGADEHEAQLESEKAAEARVIADKISTDKPLIAVVIDDMGINRKRTLDIISLKAPLTSSFLTYGQTLDKFAANAESAGHEIMIHAPMEPKVKADLAPDTLMTDMSEEQIEKRFEDMLAKFNNIKVSGINNHMGSKFTEDKERLEYVMNILKQRGMFFLDSKTTAKSKGKELAEVDGVDYAARDVFLDNENDYAYIMRQLEKTEKIARKKGFAVAIGHPKSQTYLALKDWLKTLPDKGVKLVHVSEIVAATNKIIAATDEVK